MVLSMTATSAVSVPVSVELVSAYRSVTVAPLTGVGAARRLLYAQPVAFAGQEPLP